MSNAFRGRTAVGCSMFGVTTPCVSAVQDRLDTQGYDVQVFHANGTGGRTLEKMITEGAFAAVADITTTELADELLGGVCSAGPDRLTAAVRAGIPQVVSVGALDMVNFGPRDTVPERFASRRLFEHNPAVTLMRTSPQECAALGKIIADRLNAATAPVAVHIPARGFSQISVPGGPFHDRAADDALIETLRSNLAVHVSLAVHDLSINDSEFATIVAQSLTDLLVDQNRN
ncbi:MAG TPA: Tm-1-like ATP-binding domain-containing protein [Microlunatus sp.]